jgi:hypothetical protein
MGETTMRFAKLTLRKAKGEKSALIIGSGCWDRGGTRMILDPPEGGKR